MLLNQIKHVGATYVTHRFVWFGAVLLGLMVVPQWIMVGTRSRAGIDAAPPMLAMLGMPLFFMIPFLVAQVKTQFGHSRSRLLPRFYPAHVAVLCCALVALLVIYPLCLARAAGLHPLGPIALALAMAAPAIWGTHFTRFLPILASLIVFYSLLTDWGLRWWIVDAAAHRTSHALIILVGGILIAAWVWRLCHLTEEMDDYEGFHQFLLARRTGAEAVEHRRGMASQIGRNWLASWIGDAWHNRLGGYYGGGKAGLVRLLRYGFTANPVEVQGFAMATMFIAMGVFMSQFSFVAKGSGTIGAVWFLIVFAILLPGQMAGEAMAQRRPRIAAEMMLPLRRYQLVDALFAGVIRNSVVLWLMINAAMGTVIAMSNTEVTVADAGQFLLLSGSMLFASIGIGLRTAVWPSMFKRFIALWASWMIVLLPMFALWTQRDKIGDAPFLLLPIVLLAVGVFFYRSARRAWLNLDFD
jgi:hypothetical protein